MTKKIPLGLIFVIMIINFVGCTNEQKTPKILDYPDKIIVYKKGAQKLIKSSNPEFRRIMDITNRRFNKKVCATKRTVDDKVIEQRKNDVLTIEFIYSSEQELDIVGESVSQLKYTRLFFPLESTIEECEESYLYYGDGKKYYNGALKNLNDADDLINLLNVL